MVKCEAPLCKQARFPHEYDATKCPIMSQTPQLDFDDETQTLHELNDLDDNKLKGPMSEFYSGATSETEDPLNTSFDESAQEGSSSLNQNQTQHLQASTSNQATANNPLASTNPPTIRGESNNIERFRAEWNTPAKIIIIKSNPNALFMAMMESALLIKFHKQIREGWLNISTIQPSLLSFFAIQLINVIDENLLNNFKILTLGAAWMNGGMNNNMVQDIMNEMDSKVNILSQHANDLADKLRTSEEVIENLRESANLIAANARKLDTEYKKLEIIQQQQQPIISMPVQVPNPAPIERQYRYYSMHPFSILINERKKIDYEGTIQLNPSLESTDKAFLKIIAELGPTVTSLIGGLSWNEAKSLIEWNPNVPLRDEANKIWEAFQRKHNKIPGALQTATTRRQNLNHQQ